MQGTGLRQEQQQQQEQHVDSSFKHPFTQAVGDIMEEDGVGRKKVLEEGNCTTHPKSISKLGSLHSLSPQALVGARKECL